MEGDDADGLVDQKKIGLMEVCMLNDIGHSVSFMLKEIGHL